MPTSSPSVPMPPKVRSLRLGRHPGGGGRGASLTFGSRRRSLAVTALVLLLGSTMGTCASAAAASAASSDASAPDSSLALPPEFSIRGLSSSSSSTSAPSDGLWELVWDAPSSPTNVRWGGSRPEFRLGSDVLLGYPQQDAHAQRSGRLVLALPITPSVHDQLHRSGGQDLQVWFSGRRLDVSAASASSTNVRKLTAAPTVSTNPAQVGPYKIRRRSYDLRPGINVTGYPAPLEVLAEVTYPRDLDSTTPSLGPVPLVVFLHGQHDSCFRGEQTSAFVWPCYPGYRPIPSHKGYRYVADILGSQGYVAVSIAANSINSQDFRSVDVGTTARSILIRHHLTLWAAWNAGSKTDPWGGIFRGKLDLTKVVLVGHTDGGEAVHRAAIEATSRAARVPYKIVGLVTYGPTANGRQVNPNVPSVTILGTCDGAVVGLQGQAYVDSSRDVAYSTALRSAVIVVGANGHYFNTEWTPGLSAAPSVDDWSYIDFEDSDPVCSSTNGVYRLSSQEQRVVGLTYTLALVRLVVHQEPDMLPLLDGSFVRPKVVGRADVVTHAVGGAGYRLLYKAESLGTPLLGKGMTGSECQGFISASNPSPKPVCSKSCFSCSPHFFKSPSVRSLPAPQALLLAWNKTGAVARFKIDRSQRDFRNLASVDVRIANDPDRVDGSVLEIWLVDGRGRLVKLDASLKSIEGWPGTGELDRIHARALRGSLSLHPKTEFNLKNVTQVALVAGGDTGKVWVLDVAASQRRVAAAPNLNLPVVSLELLPVLEGDRPTSAKVKVTSDRPFPTNGSIWVDRVYTGFRLPIPAGTSGVIREFTISWVGDTSYDPSQDRETGMSIVAMTGAVVGNYRGGVHVVEDEVKPAVAAVSRHVTVNEGQDLVWNFTVSTLLDSYVLFLQCVVVPPATLLANQTELTSRDVPRTWLIDNLFDAPPSEPVPLSDLPLNFYISFSPAYPPRTIIIPTAKDGVVESKDGVVALYCTDRTGYFNLGLRGIVRANSS